MFMYNIPKLTGEELIKSDNVHLYSKLIQLSKDHDNKNYFSLNLNLTTIALIAKTKLNGNLFFIGNRRAF